MIDAEPDIVSEGDERYKGEPYPEPSKPKRQRKTRAKVNPVDAKREGEVTDKEKPLFRAGTKRDIAYQALLREQGCTIAEAEELLGWKKPVVLSQFYECAKISKMKLEVAQEEGESVYRLV
jgi:hypothetical protein